MLKKWRRPMRSTEGLGGWSGGHASPPAYVLCLEDPGFSFSRDTPVGSPSQVLVKSWLKPCSKNKNWFDLCFFSAPSPRSRSCDSELLPCNFGPTSLSTYLVISFDLCLRNGGDLCPLKAVFDVATNAPCSSASLFHN